MEIPIHATPRGSHPAMDTSHVDTDYSGRPVVRPTREEVAAALAANGPTTLIGGDLPDGRRAYVGPDGKWYYEHVVDGRLVWDQPVNLADYEEDSTAP